MNLAAPRWIRHASIPATMLVLSVFGVAMIYSAGIKNVPSPVTESIWIRQLIVLCGAIVALLVAARVPRRWFRFLAIPLYLVSVGILVATLQIGTGAGTAEGTRISLEVFGFRFQPSEMAKVTTALLVAHLLAGRSQAPDRFFDLVVPILIVVLPLGLVILQPDLGTALAFVAIFFAAIYWAGTPWPLIALAASPLLSLVLSFDTLLWSAYFVVLALGMYLYRRNLRAMEWLAVVFGNLAAGALAEPIWNSLAEYQRNRILVFLDPEIDPRGAGWHLIQSKVAVGSGGLLGKGFTEGTQKRLNFLPEQHTDFIFSVVGEELGFVGTTLTLLLFGYLFHCLIRLAAASRNAFAGIFTFAILGAWLTHVIVNVGMTVGVVPITGIPLPFVSYGGSFLLMCWVAAGMILAMSHGRDGPGR